MLRVIHISDFHLESSEVPYRKQRLIEAFVNDIEPFVDENTILAFTGDLIDKGGKAFKKRENAFLQFEEIFLKRIRDKYPSLSIFIIPGNHDCDRSAVDIYQDMGLKGNLNSVESLSEFIKKNGSNRTFFSRLEKYKEYEKSIKPVNTSSQETLLESSYVLYLNNQKIGITSLNSSWLCFDDTDKEQLLIGEEQLHRSLNFIKDCSIKVALMHHPFEFLKEFDRKRIRPIIERNYDLLLCGHVHELGAAATHGLVGNFFISTANSTIGEYPNDRTYVNGYSIIDFFPKQKVDVRFRKFVEVTDQFVINTDIGNSEGLKSFPIQEEKKTEVTNKINEIFTRLKENKIEQLNEDLVIYNADTSVTVDISTLFVEPELMNMPEGANEEDSKKVKSYTVSSLSENETSYIIYGAKDSGKTVLLNKLFLQQLCNDARTKIPVLIKFNEITNKDVKKEIRDYLTISMNYLDQLLNENRILLYIDDLQFDKQFDGLSSLVDLKIQYPDLKIIATCLQDIESTFPVNYLEYNSVFRFDIVFIHSFGSKQIKGLIKKWFVFKKVDFQENLESLMKYFMELSLPRNPLIVTIFLWIFEKQENRPINISTLVEMFIEKILEKANLENVYRQTFNYGNKVRLLAHLAKFFDENGDASRSYECEYGRVLSYVENYLKNKFDGDPQAILDNLIKRGIFIKHNGNIRFKVAFFFHYFIAKYMEIDGEFKSYVLSDENYLKYAEEIQFYSSIKMDSVDVLEFVIEKAHLAFKDVNEYQSNTYKRVDEVLNNHKVISQDVDLAQIANTSKESKIDEVSNIQLDSLPVRKDIADKSKVDNKELSTILKLAANVLRNSEEIDDYEKRKRAYDLVIKSSVSFMLLYRDAIITYYEEHKESPNFLPKNMDIMFFINTLPLAHQVIMYHWVGTVKILPLLRDKIAKDDLSLNMTEYEKFLSVFIYTDLRGKDYYEVLKKFVESKRPNYVLDISLMKLITYYFLRVKDSKTEAMVLSLMADLKQRLGQVTRQGKSTFIQDIKKKKHIRISKGGKGKRK